LRPDVVKLDLGLIGSLAPLEAARIGQAVATEAERTGATVLAERVETEAAESLAHSLGATLAQGWFYGHPRPLSVAFAEPVPRLRLSNESASTSAAFTPFDILRERRPVRRVPKRTLLQISRGLERRAASLDAGPVVLSAFQDERGFEARTRDIYAALARRAAFVAALGAGMSPVPAPGVRGVSLSARDPLQAQWVVVVLGADFSAALAGLDLGAEGEDSQRSYDYALTYERGLAVEVARALMTKVLSA
jgi:hypothetical protein